MKKLLAFFLVMLLALSPSFAQAATKKTAKPKATSFQVQVVPIYYKQKGLVQVSFSKAKEIKEIEYVLTYTGSNGVPQGVQGSLLPKGKNAIKTDIFLGTCSGKTCMKQVSVKNLKLTVTTKNKLGKTASKTYTIKN